MKTIIIFGSAEWNFLYQRSRALAEELAAFGHRVYFIEPMRPLFKMLITPFSATEKKLVGTADKLKSGYSNLKIIRWHCPTAFRGTITPFIDQWLFNRHFEGLLDKEKITEATLVIAMPFWYGGLLNRKYSLDPRFKLVYDCIDEISVFARNAKILGRLLEREKMLVNDSHQIICTTAVLTDYIRKMKPGADIVSIPNGAGISHFLAEKKQASALDEIKKPIVGFVGGIYDWVDVDLVADVAERMPHVNFLMVGPSKGVDLSRLRSRPNILVPGPIDYKQVPAYVNTFNACMIPFKLNDVIEGTDPIKIYEYFSLRKPIIVTDFPEARKYGDILYIAKNRDHFVTQVEKALVEEADEAVYRKRYAVAFDASWNKRARMLEEILK